MKYLIPLIKHARFGPCLISFFWDNNLTSSDRCQEKCLNGRKPLTCKLRFFHVQWISHMPSIAICVPNIAVCLRQKGLFLNEFYLLRIYKLDFNVPIWRQIVRDGYGQFIFEVYHFILQGSASCGECGLWTLWIRLILRFVWFSVLWIAFEWSYYSTFSWTILGSHRIALNLP